MSEDGDQDDERFRRVIMDMITEAMKSGKFPGEGNFSITIAGGNLPIDIIPPAAMSPDEDDPNAIQDIKPHTEVHKIDDRIIIAADLPGAGKESTAIAMEEDDIIITSLADRIRYSARIKVPPIKKETLKYSIKNGLLEVSASGL
jgi:HSP20 family molecular chaperone IbpA